MRVLLIFFIIMFTNSCSKPKVVLICGDHVCINKSEAKQYFKEKSSLDEGWINGGFFVIEPRFLNYIKGDKTFLERFPLENAARKNQLVAYKHNGFWHCMDTLRDKIALNKLWDNNQAPWKIW